VLELLLEQLLDLALTLLGLFQITMGLLVSI